MAIVFQLNGGWIDRQTKIQGRVDACLSYVYGRLPAATSIAGALVGIQLGPVGRTGISIVGELCRGWGSETDTDTYTCGKGDLCALLANKFACIHD